MGNYYLKICPVPVFTIHWNKKILDPLITDMLYLNAHFKISAKPFLWRAQLNIEWCVGVCLISVCLSVSVSPSVAKSCSFLLGELTNPLLL